MMTPSFNITSIRKIYCIAICGMGMGSLAGLLKAAGCEVSGSDAHTYPPMSDQLRAQGIPVHEGYAAENVPADADLVIVGNAISKGHPEVEAAERLGFQMISMADCLSEYFLKSKTSIVVAGTHGKTTSTCLLAWLLEAAGQNPSFLVGGILKNFGRSWQLGDGPHFVIEGDEYDTAFFDKTPKFLHYRPKQAILNAVEFDHVDIYRDLDAVMAAFRQFVELVPPTGHLYAFADSANVSSLIEFAKCPVTTFGAGQKADYRLLDIKSEAKGTAIRYLDKNGLEQTLVSPMPGRHNAFNLLGVCACLTDLKVEMEKIEFGLSEFSGIKRRQEVRGVVRDITVIDDFAHHPTAVRETLEALKALYAEKKIWAVFEPRSNTSRRNIFQREFAESLNCADEVILAPPYDNGKIPQEELLDVEKVAADIRKVGGHAEPLKSVDDIVTALSDRAKPGDVVAILSNGGFGGIHEKLLSRLAEIS